MTAAMFAINILPIHPLHSMQGLFRAVCSFRVDRIEVRSVYSSQKDEFKGVYSFQRLSSGVFIHCGICCCFLFETKYVPSNCHEMICVFLLDVLL